MLNGLKITEPISGKSSLCSIEVDITKPIQASWIASDGTLYSSVKNTIFRSLDQGITWQQLRTFDTETIDSVYVSRDGCLYASPGLDAKRNDSGLWRSTDAGMTWVRGLPLSSGSSIWAIDEDDIGTLFVGVYTRGERKNAKIYRSEDHGKGWRTVYYDSKARHVHALAIDKSTSSIYAAIGDKFVPHSNIAYLIKSTDGGKKWRKILTELPQMSALAVVPGARLFGSDDTTNGEIYRSTDDQTATKVLDTMAHSFCFWIRNDQQRGLLYASFVNGEADKKTAGIYVSQDNGLNWHLHRSFNSSYAYDGSSRATNFNQGIMYHSLRLQGTHVNGVKAQNCTPNQLVGIRNE